MGVFGILGLVGGMLVAFSGVCAAVSYSRKVANDDKPVEQPKVEEPMEVEPVKEEVVEQPKVVEPIVEQPKIDETKVVIPEIKPITIIFKHQFEFPNFPQTITFGGANAEPVKQIEPVKEEVVDIPVPAPQEEMVIGDAELEEEENEDKQKYFHIDSFAEKMLFNVDTRTQLYYDALNNKMLTFSKVHARLSRKCMSYRYGRDLIAKITVRGKTMKMHFALNVKDYSESVYFQKDMSDVKSYVDVPFTVKVKSDRGLKNAVALIYELVEKFGIRNKREIVEVDSMEEIRNFVSMENTGVAVAPAKAKPAPVINIKPTPKKVVAPAPKKVVAPAPKKVVAPAPKKVVVKSVPKIEVAPTVDESEDEKDKLVINSVSFAKRMLKIVDAKSLDYYDQINNAFLNYKKVSARLSKKGMSYRLGRKLIGKITARGKTLKLNLALNVKDFENSVYFQTDMSDMKAFEEVPFGVKVKSDRGLKNALKLVDALAEKEGLVAKKEVETVKSIKELKDFYKTENQK